MSRTTIHSSPTIIKYIYTTNNPTSISIMHHYKYPLISTLLIIKFKSCFPTTKLILPNSINMSSQFNAGQNRAHAQAATEQFVDSAKDTASRAHDKAHDALGHSQGQAQQSKEDNATFLQQTAESAANIAQGALDGVKNTLGMGEQRNQKK